MANGNSKRAKALNIICLTAVFVLSFILIHLFINVYQTSDYPAHIRQALRGEGYSLISLLIVICHKITGSDLLFTIIMAMISALTVVANAFFMKSSLKLLGEETKMTDLIPLACSTLLICKLCLPEWSGYYYLNSFVTQSWHNSTYTLMRLLATLTLSFYYVIECSYQKTLDYKKLFFFFLFLSLTNMSKPNFVIAFAPIMLAVLIYDFIKSKGKTFKNAFVFGVLVLLACAILIFQMKTSFPEGGENGVEFSIANAISYILRDKKMPLYLLLNYTFPLYVIYLMIRNKNRIKGMNIRMMIESWLMVFSSIFIYLFIRETGPRAADGNFGWGMPFFAYSLFSICLSYLSAMKNKKIIDETEYKTGRMIYYLHIVFGFFYFALLFMGYLSWDI